jgi:hypothetical protein
MNKLKTKNKNYTKDLLEKTIKRDNAILINNYEKLYSKIKIIFVCKCGNKAIKQFHCILLKGGAFCKKCTNKNTIEKSIQTNIEKYGVEHPFQLKEFQDKFKKTNIEKYGVEHPFQLKEFQDKFKKTNIKKYGVENPLQSKELKAKRANTNIIKYGNICSAANVNIKQKIKDANIEKYGVEYPAQNIELQEKIQNNSKKYKKYKMPSGIIRNVQGYEPFALDDLIKRYSEEQIKTRRKDVPRLEYIFENKKHYYFPDIYISNENKIIEVKSNYTYNLSPDIRELKKNSCIINGYKFEFWIFDDKGNKIVI